MTKTRSSICATLTSTKICASAANIPRMIAEAVVPTMQTRAELYDFLGYHAYEQKLDALFAGARSDE